MVTISSNNVLWFQQVLKANATDVDLPNFGDTSEDEESEEEEEANAKDVDLPNLGDTNDDEKSEEEEDKFVADKQKKGVVSKKAAQELLIAQLLQLPIQQWIE